MGGIYPAQPVDVSGTSYRYGQVSMSDILIYDTVNATWRNATAGGLLPRPRMDHTLTLSSFIMTTL